MFSWMFPAHVEDGSWKLFDFSARLRQVEIISYANVRHANNSVFCFTPERKVYTKLDNSH